jgi:single-strand DNA-binding protein
MFKGVNKVLLVGHLFSDPTIRSFGDSGSSVASFMLITKDEIKDKTTGQPKEINQYHKISAFGRMADYIRDAQLRKDDCIMVQGRLQTRKYKNKDEVEVYTTEVIVANVESLKEQQSQGTQYSEGKPMPLVHIEPFSDEEIPF